MHPERGYARAQQLLKDRFGDEFVIGELWGQRLLSAGARVPLQEFADELHTCYESLYALDTLEELQMQINLLEIIKKLPSYLQNKWRDKVRRLKTQECRRPDLQDVVEYMEEAASDPVYGNQSQKSEKNPPSTRATYATSTSSSCPVCEREGHEVLSCERFATLQPEDRLQTAIRLKLCFVCLRGGHITWDYTSKTRCKAEDCGRKLREQGCRRREHAAGSRNRETSAEEPLTTGSIYHAQGKEDRPRDASPSRGTRIALPLIPIPVYSPESKRSHLTYALLDNGSNVTLCHERLLRILDL